MENVISSSKISQSSVLCFDIYINKLTGKLKKEGWQYGLNNSLNKDGVTIQFREFDNSDKSSLAIVIFVQCASGDSRQYSIIFIADQSSEFQLWEDLITDLDNQILEAQKAKSLASPSVASPNWFINELGFFVRRTPNAKSRYTTNRIIFDEDGTVIADDLSYADELDVLKSRYNKESLDKIVV